jgi:hypothetical protein
MRIITRLPHSPTRLSTVKGVLDKRQQAFLSLRLTTPQSRNLPVAEYESGVIQGVSFGFQEARMAFSRGLSPVLRAIEEDFEERLPGYNKSRREGLVTLAAVMVETRSANLMELAASLPRKIGSRDHRYQYISRLLGNAKIDCDEVMAVYAGEIFARLAAQGQTIVVML